MSADPATEGLRAYIVGGAVRDELLGLPAGDRDWVVVGSTPEEMTRRGFTPVGGDFPVFLHPRTHEEYALARTERKAGRGYQGFTFHTGADVSLEDDLRRRDLTVNAIARLPDGTLADPLGGQRDLRDRILRHVGAAFAEDPVRILRLARFAARLGGFSIAPETLELCRQMVDSGEVDALVPERVWREVSRGLMAGHPARMFEVLRQTQALPRVMPGLVLEAGLAADLDRAAAAELPLPGRYALLCRDTPDAAALHRHLRVPTDCADQARLLPEILAGVGASESAVAQQAEAAWALMERADVMRKPQRFVELLQVAALLAPVDLPSWQLRIEAVRGIDAGAIARRCKGDPAAIKQELRAARVAALGG